MAKAQTSVYTRDVPQISRQAHELAMAIGRGRGNTGNSKRTYQQSVVYNPETGQNEVYKFNTSTGEVKPTNAVRGFKMGKDPETGLVMPESESYSRTKQTLSRNKPKNLRELLKGPEGEPPKPVAFQATPAQRDAVQGLRKELHTSPLFKDAANKLASAKEAQTVLSEASTNPQATKMVGTVIARIFEPGGRLTDQDVVRYVGDPRLLQQLQIQARLWTRGSFPPETMDNLNHVMQAYSRAQKERLQKMAGPIIQGFSSDYQMPPEEVWSRVMGPMSALINKRPSTTRKKPLPTKKKPVEQMTEEETDAELRGGK